MPFSGPASQMQMMICLLTVQSYVYRSFTMIICAFGGIPDTNDHG